MSLGGTSSSRRGREHYELQSSRWLSRGREPTGVRGGTRTRGDRHASNPPWGWQLRELRRKIEILKSLRIWKRPSFHYRVLRDNEVVLMRGLQNGDTSRQIHVLFDVGTAAGLTDRELLERCGPCGRGVGAGLCRSRRAPRAARVPRLPADAPRSTRSTRCAGCLSGRISGTDPQGRLDPKPRLGGELALRRSAPRRV